MQSLGKFKLQVSQILGGVATGLLLVGVPAARRPGPHHRRPVRPHQGHRAASLDQLLPQHRHPSRRLRNRWSTPAKLP